MTGVVYLLHLDAPGYAHAKHYTGNPESSRFLKVQHALVSRKLAELSADGAGEMSASGRPVELGFGDGELAPVGVGLGPAGVVSARVAKMRPGNTTNVWNHPRPCSPTPTACSKKRSAEEGG